MLLIKRDALAKVAVDPKPFQNRFSWRQNSYENIRGGSFLMNIPLADISCIRRRTAATTECATTQACERTATSDKQEERSSSPRKWLANMV
jgi:hypothetical protein